MDDVHHYRLLARSLTELTAALRGGTAQFPDICAIALRYTGLWKVIICPLLIHSLEPNRDLHDLHDGRDPWRKARRHQAHSDGRP